MVVMAGAGCMVVRVRVWLLGGAGMRRSHHCSSACHVMQYIPHQHGWHECGPVGCVDAVEAAAALRGWRRGGAVRVGVVR